MGGADVHDQLRLQRYSIQKPMRMRKYYQTIFLGLIDMALVNCYILHKLVFAKRFPGKTLPTHAQFMTTMQTALLGIVETDFVGDLSIEAMFESPVPGRTRVLSHLPSKNTIQQVDTFRTSNVRGKQVRKRRQ